jgi:Ca2+-binding RTX toxin-like protein
VQNDRQRAGVSSFRTLDRCVWLLAFTVLLGLVAAASVALGAQADDLEPRPANAAPAPTPAELAPIEKEEREQAEWLESPQAEEQREESETAYVDLSAGEAKGLLTEAFAATLDGLDGDPGRILSTLDVEKTLGTTSALVEGPEGTKAILNSSTPVVSDLGGEGSRPVDLSLEQSGEGFVPANPLEEVVLPDSAADPIRLEGGIDIELPASADQPATRLGEMNLFYADTAADTDTLVAPRGTGVEVYSQLRSPESPEELRFDLSLPDGTQLRPSEKGSGAEVVSADGDVVTEVTPPTASDAQGATVPVTMEVKGNSLVLSVPHRGAEFAYPILVDPNFVNNTTNFDEWLLGPGNYGGYYMQRVPGSLDAFSWANTWYPEWSSANWVYVAVNQTTYIAAATFSPIYFLANGCYGENPHGYVGIFNTATQSFEGHFGNYWGGNISNATWESGWVGGYNTRQAMIGIGTYGGVSIPCNHELFVGGYSIQESDPYAPSITSVTGIPAAGAWFDPTAAGSASIGVSDNGLGVQEITINDGGGTSVRSLGCSGASGSRCPTSTTWSVVPPYVEGERTLTISTRDPVANSSSWTRATKVDGTAPTTTVTNTLTATTLSAKVEAVDGVSGNARSGVKEVKVYVDKVLKETRTNTCATSGCPFTLNFTYSQALSGLGAGTHTVEAVAFDQLNHQRTATATFVLEAPNTVLDSGPEGLTKNATPTFTYHSTQASSTFACSIDSGAFASCPSTGYTAAKLSDGAHTFKVKATNPAGIEDPSPASRSFTVDTTPPETVIEYGPSGLTNNPKPTFGYSSPDPTASFECRVDAAAFERCGPDSEQIEPALADGAHTFAVRAVDRAGNIDGTPATRSFTVDATSPTVEILTGPSGFTKSTKPKFTWQASGQTSLQCALDSNNAELDEPGYGPCTASTYYEPATALADGSYAFRVKASDGAGNAATDSRFFTIDTVAPDTTIISGPSGTTDDQKPSFGFSSNEPSVSFACRFDAEAFAPCSGPGATHMPSTALAPGTHSFEVRATDQAGNVDGTPAKRSFTVFIGAPQTKIDSGPEGPTVNTSPTFTYSADEAATFECRVDLAAYASCPSTGRQVAVQPEGEHVFEVRARNAAGVDPTPARRIFIVDTSNPDAPVLGGEVFVEPGPYGLKLTIVAKDGDRSTPATTRAGVESAVLQIDGQQVAALRTRCGPLGCPDEMEREYQVSPYKVKGAHAYKLIVRDPLGHERAAEWSRTIPSSSIWKLLARSGPCTTKTIYVDESPYVGNGCPEKIKVKPGYSVKRIEGKGGADTIIGGAGEEILKGGEGNDIIRGARSNDKIYGEGGEDALYGGIGDDKLHGGTSNDTLDGGPGGDDEFGEPGDDTVRGGQGKDFLKGGSKKDGDSGNDTVSFADAISPGFQINATPALPGGEITERSDNTTGVDVDINAGGGGTANNGSLNEERGGTDNFAEFDHVIGSAFDDVFRRADSKISVDTGPGGDIVVGAGEANVEADGSQDFVEGKGEPRSISHPDRVEFGLQNTNAAGKEFDLFYAGSSKPDGSVEIRLMEKKAEFKFPVGAPGGKVEGCPGNVAEDTTFVCTIPPGRTLGAVVAAGNGGEDILSVLGRDEFSDGAVVLVGGPGRDTLKGSGGEDVLIDGVAQNAVGKKEILRGFGADDVMIQGDGVDNVFGGSGNDLLVSADVCGDDTGGDELNGGPGADNAQFHPFTAAKGVYVDLGAKKFGEVDTKPKCSDVVQVEDLEGSPQGDNFIALPSRNFLLGRGGPDTFITKGGHDKVNAKDDGVDERIDCAKDEGAHIHVDPKQELPHGYPRDALVNTKLFRNCFRKTIDGAGRAYSDKKTGSASLLAAAERPSPERLERLTGSYASQPPESWTEALDDSSNLASYYALDDVEGTAATNAEDESLDGSYEAAGVGPSVNGPGPNIGVAGVLLEEEGSAVALDGIDDKVSLPGAIGLDAAGDQGFSMELLAKFSKAPSGREYLFATGQGEDGLFIYRSANGILTLATGQDASAPQVDTYVPVADSAWHQIAAVVEDKSLTIYLDGIPSRIGFGESVAPKLSELAGPTTVGVAPGTTGFLAGTVDELSTYTGTLSEAEVLAHLLEMTITPPFEVLIPEAEKVDTDGDGVTDGADNCPRLANPDQADVDQNGVGDACLTPDKDEDGIEDQTDNCPEAANSDQADTNGDGVGNVCSGFAPDVVTEAATEVKANTVKLNGSVLPGGTATEYHFEYGTTTSYGKSVPVPDASLSSGPNAIPVSQVASGLTPQTTYHYRLVAENGAGVSAGEDRTFTTLKSIPTQLANLAVVEPFNGTSTSTSNFNALWSTLGWVSGQKGWDYATGWGPIEAFPVAHGASYSKSIAASSNGLAVAATLNEPPTISERYFSLWLAMPSPGAALRAGYELRFTETATANVYDVTLSSWNGGSKALLAQKAAFNLPAKSQFAVAAIGGMVSVWTAPAGGAFTELLSAKSGTYASGYSGLEAAGNFTRLTNFKTGALGP